MVIQHNLTAANSNRMLNLTSSSLAKTSEKLSSGYRINRAADDAAGLAISEKMRRQIRGLTQASKNTQDGVSFCQVADGALNEMHDILKRCEELAVQASNATNSDTDREYINSEVQQLSSEIDRIHETALFNELRVFTDAGVIPDKNGTIPQSMISADGNLTLSVGDVNVTFSFVDTTGTVIPTPSAVQATGDANPSSIANSSLAQFAVKAAADAISNLSNNFPSLFSRSSTNDIKIGLELSDQAKGGTLATASLSLATGSNSTTMSYKMWVDTKDYPIDAFDSMTDAEKADLAGVIAHEMTHLLMYDTVTDGMFGAFPDWFVEGMAQTSSGDNNWLSNYLSPSSTDAEINSYKAKMTTMPYGAGYAACMYLGYVAGSGNLAPSSASDVTSSVISSGLDSVLTNLANGKNLDQAINDATGGKFTSVADFQNKFTSAGNTDSLKFMREFLNARGTNGAGSLFGSIGSSESSVFAPNSLTGTYGGYTINPDSQWYSNAFGTGYIFPQNLPSTGGGSGGGTGNDRAGFNLQVGSESGQYIYVTQFNASASALMGSQNMDVSTIAAAQSTIDLVKEAEGRVSVMRSYYGGLQNRLEHTINNLDNVIENTTSAESIIRDTDMAEYMVKYSNKRILFQAGNSMLSQANQNQQHVLSLLQ